MEDASLGSLHCFNPSSSARMGAAFLVIKKSFLRYLNIFREKQHPEWEGWNSNSEKTSLTDRGSC